MIVIRNNKFYTKTDGGCIGLCLGDSIRFKVETDGRIYTRLFGRDHRLEFPIDATAVGLWVEANLRLTGEVDVQTICTPVDALGGRVVKVDSTGVYFRSGHWVAGHYDVKVNEDVYLKDGRVYRSDKHSLLPMVADGFVFCGGTHQTLLVDIKTVDPDYGIQCDIDGGAFLLPGNSVGGKEGLAFVSAGDPMTCKPVPNLNYSRQTIGRGRGPVIVVMTKTLKDFKVIRIGTDYYKIPPFPSPGEGERAVVHVSDSGLLIVDRHYPRMRRDKEGFAVEDGPILGDQIDFKIIKIARGPICCLITGEFSTGKRFLWNRGTKVVDKWGLKEGERYTAYGHVIKPITRQIHLTNPTFRVPGRGMAFSSLDVDVLHYAGNRAWVKLNDGQDYFIDLAGRDKPLPGRYFMTFTQGGILEFRAVVTDEDKWTYSPGRQTKVGDVSVTINADATKVRELLDKITKTQRAITEVGKYLKRPTKQFKGTYSNEGLRIH